MQELKVKNLVICSTLNQITNYLVIEKCIPERIFNITFDDEAKKILNKNIKIKDWDDQLLSACKHLGYKKFTNIEIGIEDIYATKDVLDKINDIVSEIKEPIYWHITGGQRTIALAISQLQSYENRKNDKLLYVEGNTEKLVLSNINGSFQDCNISYGNPNLSIKKVFNLAGFKTREPKSTIIFKEKGKTNDTNQFKKEHEFYKELYSLMCPQNLQSIGGITSIDIMKFRNSLLESNIINNSGKSPNCKNDSKERTEYVRGHFEILLKKYKSLSDIDYDILNSDEIRGAYPAGYIFEKITAHKIYDVIKNNNKIVEMQSSIKTYFDDENKYKMNGKSSIIDELDIVLLTDTGKLINFECKSGSMDGNNGKSHNYTTYRLAGVFGMPILLSPLYRKEKITENSCTSKDYENQIKSLRAAENAELDVWGIDEIEEELNKLLSVTI